MVPQQRCSHTQASREGGAAVSTALPTCHERAVQPSQRPCPHVTRGRCSRLNGLAHMSREGGAAVSTALPTCHSRLQQDDSVCGTDYKLPPSSNGKPILCLIMNTACCRQYAEPVTKLLTRKQQNKFINCPKPERLTGRKHICSQLSLVVKVIFGDG